MSVRKIKKYPNRRLYDTGISKYVKSEDVRDLLVSGEQISIVDSQSGRDITRSVLLYILADEALDDDATPVFSEAMLSEAVRFTDDFMAGPLALLLEKTMQMFLQYENVFRTQMQNFDAEDPFSMIEKLTAIQAEVLEDANKQLTNAS